MSTNPTPRLRGRKGQEQRDRRLQRTNYLCEWCRDKGIIRLADQVDHIVPLSQGGPDTDENTRNLCDECEAIARAEQFDRAKPMQFKDGAPDWSTR